LMRRIKKGFSSAGWWLPTIPGKEFFPQLPESYSPPSSRQNCRFCLMIFFANPSVFFSLSPIQPQATFVQLVLFALSGVIWFDPLRCVSETWRRPLRAAFPLFLDSPPSVSSGHRSVRRLHRTPFSCFQEPRLQVSLSP